MSPIDHPIIRRFIEDAGNTTQALGVGRVIGQLFAYLYFSEEPRGLDDMKEALGISKGSASMGVRQLEQWGAVQRVWVKGDRRDYYTANDYFGQIVRCVMVDLMGKRLAGLAASLDAAEEELNAADQTTDHRPQTTDLKTNHKFIKARVQRLREFQQKVKTTGNKPLVTLWLM